MNADLDFQVIFDFTSDKPVVVEPSAGQISSDAGLLPFRQLDEQLGLTRQIAGALTDLRHQEYVDESENRNKELKCGLQADRLSDHRYFANLFRLYLHATAHNLLVRMRRIVVDPPTDPVAINSFGEATEPDVPVEALAGRRRRQWHNHRREHDPLGEGQVCTWRTRLIKVAAYVFESARRVVVRLSSSWPYLNHFAKVSQQILAGGRASFDSS